MHRCLSILLALLGCWVISGTARAEVKLDLATTYAGAQLQAETVRELAKRVSEATKGQVVINVHEGGALGLKDEDQFTAVADGIVPMANILMGAAVGTSPIFGLSTCPFMVGDFKEARMLLEIARPYYEKEAAKFNQKILYTSPWPPSAIHAKRGIEKYTDLAGLRIRTYDKNGTDVLRKGGANPVSMSWGDVYPALATGTIDSVLTSSTSAVAGKFWEVLTDTTRVNFAIPVNMININLSAWGKLTKEQQAAIEKIGKEMDELQWKLAEKGMVDDEATLKKHGMKIHAEVSPELAGKLRGSGEEVTQAWVMKAGPDGKAILAEFEKKRTK